MSREIQHRRREPAPGVFRLTLPLPFPGLDEVNAYLLDDGEAVTLVDTGLYLPGRRRAITDGTTSWRLSPLATGRLRTSPA